MTPLSFPVGLNERIPWCILASLSEGICLVEAASGQIVWHNLAFAEACGAPSSLTEKTIRSFFPSWPNVDDCDPQVRTEWVFRITSLESWHCIYAARSATKRLAARSDSLTGLADRSEFEQRLHTAWDQFHLSDGPPFALIFIDLNHFKRINDAWGHLVGDEVLRKAAKRLKSAFREGDFLARYGGDEFVALFLGVRNPDALAKLVQRLNKSLIEPIRLEEHAVAISASVGVVSSNDGYSTPEEMLQAADRAMYATKRIQ